MIKIPNSYFYYATPELSGIGQYLSVKHRRFLSEFIENSSLTIATKSLTEKYCAVKGDAQSFALQEFEVCVLAASRQG